MMTSVLVLWERLMPPCGLHLKISLNRWLLIVSLGLRLGLNVNFFPPQLLNIWKIEKVKVVYSNLRNLLYQIVGWNYPSKYFDSYFAGFWLRQMRLLNEFKYIGGTKFWNNHFLKCHLNYSFRSNDNFYFDKNSLFEIGGLKFYNCAWKSCKPQHIKTHRLRWQLRLQYQRRSYLSTVTYYKF